MKSVFLDLKETASYVRLSTRQVQRLCALGEFPKSRQLSAQRVAWLVRELEEWAESRPVSSILPVGCAA